MKRLLSLLVLSALVALPCSGADAQVATNPAVVTQSQTDSATATSAHMTFAVTNSLPPSMPALTLPPVAVSFTYTVASDPATPVTQTTNLATVTLPATASAMTFSPIKFVLPAALSLIMDAATVPGTVMLVNLSDGSTQVTLTPAPLDGGQSASWGWTVSRKAAK